MQWGGTPRTTSFGSSTQLTAAITAVDLAQVGTQQITVANAASAVSSAATFTTTAPAAPQISSVSPPAVAKGQAFTLTVKGANFIKSSTVNWNGSTRTTTYADNTILTAAIPATDVPNTGSAQVTVATPSPGGGSSSATTVAIANASPVITTLSPASALVNSPGFTLHVTGSGFEPGVVVQVNRIGRVTTVVSSTALDAAILASDLTAAGTIEITATNPAPNLGISNVLIFAVASPVPQITSLSPSSAFAGSASVPVIVQGSSFQPNSVVQWNGKAIGTEYVSSTELHVTVGGLVPNSAVQNGELAHVGTNTVTVFTPAPGGGTSNSLPFASLPSDPPVTQTQYPATAFIAVSADARFAAIVNTQPFAPPSDLYEWDTCNGAPAGCTPGKVFVAQFVQERPSISDNGRYVAYMHIPLVNGIPSGIEVGETDTCQGAGSGCTPSTILASPPSTAGQSDLQVMSASGRYVAFDHRPNGAPDSLLLRDTCLGAVACVPFTTVIADNTGNPVVHAFEPIKVLQDGRYVVYIEGRRVGSTSILLFAFRVRDTCLGAAPGCTPSTRDIALPPDAPTASISADQRYVAFETNQPLLPEDTNGIADVYVQDTCFGADPGCVPSYVLASRKSDSTLSTAGFGYNSIELSATGRFVTFSTATALEPNDTNGPLNGDDVYVVDTCLTAAPGCSPTLARMSVDPSGAQGNGNSGQPQGNSAAGGLQITPDGRWVAFFTEAPNLGADITGGTVLARTPF